MHPCICARCPWHHQRHSLHRQANRLGLAQCGLAAQSTRMPSSSPTPTRRRKSSSASVHLSFTSASPQSNDHSPKPPFNHPRSSQHSLASPSTNRSISSRDRNGYFESSNGLDGPIDSGYANSLGNLADELADAFDEEEDNDDEHGFQAGASGGLYDRAEIIRHDQLKENVHPVFGNALQNGHTTSISPARQGTSELSLSPPEQSSHRGHTRKDSQNERSGSGDDTDGDVTHSPVLEARRAAVESLARQGPQANVSDADEIVQRVADALKDLGSQAGVENGATR